MAQMYERNVVFINVYGHNADDKTYFKPLCYFLEENQENEFINGGDFNTVLEPKLNKLEGYPNTRIKSRATIQTSIETIDLNDNYYKIYIFSKLDFFPYCQIYKLTQF